MNLTSLMLAKVEQYQEEMAAEVVARDSRGETVAAANLARDYRRLTAVRCYLEDRERRAA